MSEAADKKIAELEAQNAILQHSVRRLSDINNDRLEEVILHEERWKNLKAWVTRNSKSPNESEMAQIMWKAMLAMMEELEENDETQADG